MRSKKNNDGLCEKQKIPVRLRESNFTQPITILTIGETIQENHLHN